MKSLHILAPKKLFFIVELNDNVIWTIISVEFKASSPTGIYKARPLHLTHNDVLIIYTKMRATEI